ncbi:diacylglycerol kinase family protein [Desulforamulus ruminis]|uniref:Diacylglycerol kinase n=1 Tax=Desulforamulus ruminis (strain ATCC 23193 / DSM 2154 / NCIMB 8452 / DL) TaxID=696281 RepID=F6DMW9_DESRL|nr:diacylglycerol kinase family protein [Desulforamulus ruminis]AEG59427.1 diacylglycerol kinase [Desulforamulus ruminis DSM 2154]
MILSRKPFYRSFLYALAGILHALKTQRNMKVHMVATFLVVTVGLFLRLSRGEWLAITFAVFLVLMAEMLNTAIEAALDLYCPRQHPLAKIAKDCAAGAVLLAAINSIIVAYLVLWPKMAG